MQVLELFCSHKIMVREHFSSHASYVSFPAKTKSDISGVAEHYWHFQFFCNQIRGMLECVVAFPHGSRSLPASPCDQHQLLVEGGISCAKKMRDGETSESE